MVRTLVTHLPNGSCATFLFLPYFCEIMPFFMRVAWQKRHEESTVCTKKVFDFNQVLFLGDCG